MNHFPQFYQISEKWIFFHNIANLMSNISLHKSNIRHFKVTNIRFIQGWATNTYKYVIVVYGWPLPRVAIRLFDNVKVWSRSLPEKVSCSM